MLGTFPQQAFESLLLNLATTPGPSLNETPRRLMLEKFFNQANINTQTDAAGNLWLSFGPEGWNEAIVYDAHIDVVEQGYVENLTRENGQLIGRGVADDLTAVTMLALLAKTIAQNNIPLSRPLKLLFSVGEEGEGGLKGVRQMVHDHASPPYLFIAFDLSLDTYSIAATGSKRYAIEIDCPGGHSWGNFGSPNAIEQLVDFLHQLKQTYQQIAPHTESLLSYNLGLIEGGQNINSIARTAKVKIEFRSNAPAALLKIDTALLNLINQFKPHPDVTISHTIIDERPAASPVKPERIEPLIQQILMEQGVTPTTKPRSTNINIPLSVGWPAICIGVCKGGNYHREDEYVHLDSLPQGWLFLDKLSTKLLT